MSFLRRVEYLPREIREKPGPAAGALAAVVIALVCAMLQDVLGVRGLLVSIAAAGVVFFGINSYDRRKPGRYKFIATLLSGLLLVQALIVYRSHLRDVDAAMYTVFGVLCGLGWAVTFAAIFLSPILIGIKLWTSMAGHRLQRHLVAKGYSWMTAGQAEKLYMKIGSKAYRLPEFEALGVLPGYIDGDALSMAQFAKYLPQH